MVTSSFLRKQSPEGAVTSTNNVVASATADATTPPTEDVSASASKPQDQAVLPASNMEYVLSALDMTSFCELWVQLEVEYITGLISIFGIIIIV